MGGGSNNSASGNYATVGGGVGNTASGHAATVGGGEANTASAERTTVPGGYRNTAAGYFSLAAGYRAKANHSGAFVWGDFSGEDVGSTASNQFIAFGLGEDDQHISTVDADGVALAAIQGLYRELLERDTRIEALEGRLAALETSSVGATGRSPLQASFGHAAAPEELLAAPREGRASPAPTTAMPGTTGWQDLGSALPGLMAGGLALGLVVACRPRKERP